jgi:hypothetical protein
MDHSWIPKKILTNNPKRRQKYRTQTVKRDRPTYSSRGWNRSCKAKSMMIKMMEDEDVETRT